jgi:thioredoxin-like negative regulator of GroEL
MQQGNYHLPMLPDPQGTIAGRYGVTGVPTVVIADKDGRFVTTKIGSTTEQELVSLLQAAIK